MLLRAESSFKSFVVDPVKAEWKMDDSKKEGVRKRAFE